MREHIFRAKTKDTGEWVEGFPVGWQNESGDISMVDKRFGACIDSDGNLIMLQAPFVVKVDPETVCEFTGLTDKNGKKIWEKDVVNHGYENGCGKFYGLYKIEYSINDACYNLVALDPCNSTKRLTKGNIKSRHTEIIGSVFDTPELLST